MSNSKERKSQEWWEKLRRRSVKPKWRVIWQSSNAVSALLLNVWWSVVSDETASYHGVWRVPAALCKNWDQWCLKTSSTSVLDDWLQMSHRLLWHLWTLIYCSCFRRHRENNLPVRRREERGPECYQWGQFIHFFLNGAQFSQYHSD